MTAHEKFLQLQLDELVKTWPAGAPKFLRHLTKAQVRDTLKGIGRVEGMPAAELTPEIAVLREGWRAKIREGHAALIEMGRGLVEIKEMLAVGEEEFWVCITQDHDIPRESAELAMQAFSESAASS